MRFRDYLNANPEKVSEYSSLKLTLAKQFAHNVGEYTSNKEGFIKSVDIEAAKAGLRPLRVRYPNRRKSSWSQEEIRRAIEANRSLYLTYFAKYTEDSRIVFQPDITIVQSKIASLNYAFSARFSDRSVAERVAQVGNLFQVPYYWLVSEFDTPPNLGERLLAQGLRKIESLTNLYLELKGEHPVSGELTFRQAETPKLLKEMVGLEKENPLLERFHASLPPLLYSSDVSYQMHLAYQGEMVVARATLVLHANVAGIYHIVTAPSERRRGIATALIQHLLNVSMKSGFRMATLQAAPDVSSLYTRLGFQPCGQVQLFCKESRS